jgi:hypothetical protein
MRFISTFLSNRAIFGALMLGIILCIEASAAQSDMESQKSELIGTLSISDILIQPQFVSTEDSTNNFELGRSYLFLSWKMNKELSSHFGLGREELINHNTRLKVNSNNTDEFKNFTFFEAYGQLDSKYGTVRAGLIPLSFGWEGVHKESEWIFPRTLFYGGEDKSYLTQNFGLRDYGVSYFVSYKDFYTQTTVHNGENGPDLDGKIWNTAVVGWKNKSGLEGAISMSNGKYQNGNTNPVLDLTYANSFFGFQFYDMLLMAEGSFGQQEKSFITAPGEDIRTRFWGWHVDASHPLKKGVALLARYELYDPDTNYKDDRTQRVIVGFDFSSELRTSNLYVWGIKNTEEGHDLNNDQIMVLWKVRSLSIF